MKNFCRGLAFCFCPVGRLYETGLSAAEAGCRTLFLRLKRECGFMVPPRAALFYLATHLDFIWQRTSISITSSSPAWRVPTGFRWRESGRRAESDSGGDGLLANPRIVARRRFQSSGRRHRNRSGGFCCFSPPKSREKTFWYFWPQKYKKKKVCGNCNFPEPSQTFSVKPRKTLL